jgi:predicted GNAT family acetyltransferase
MEEHAPVEVRHNPEERRFEAEVEGGRALLTYDRPGREIHLLHTEVPSASEGRGVGSALVRSALEHAREERLTVVPLCPFVRAYLERHPESRELLRPRG